MQQQPHNTLVKRPDSTPSPIIALVKGTIKIMDDLVNVMRLEIEVLTARNMVEHKEILPRKQRLTLDYRANMKAIAAQPGIMKQIPEDLRQAVKIAAQKLADMADRNAKFLRNGVIATQRLIQTIISIVKEEVLPVPTYKNTSAAGFDQKSYSPTCKPVAVIRTA